MKFLIIGHSVADNIFLNGKETLKPGGIYYSTLGLNSFGNKNDEIFPLTEIDNANKHLFSELYENRCNNKYIRTLDSIPSINIKISGDSVKCDSFKNIDRNLFINKEIDFIEFDGILVNMATGFDITLEDLRFIRKNYKGLIYLDVHMLSYSFDQNAGRSLRLIPDIEEWISAADIIQVNNHEKWALSEKKNEFEIAEEIVKNGLKCLLITKGGLGSTVFYREANSLKCINYNTKKNNLPKKVGSGDIFGATFFYFYLQDNNLFTAFRVANISAGLSIEYNNINDFVKLKNDTLGKLN
jgi:hypothetical protein